MLFSKKIIKNYSMKKIHKIIVFPKEKNTIIIINEEKLE